MKQGSFQWLEQLIGIGVKKENLTSIIDMLWSIIETKEIEDLLRFGTPNKLNGKKYKY